MAEDKVSKLLGMLSSVLPGAKINVRAAEETTDAGTVEHMYKPREAVFGAVAHDMVAAGWSVFPQENDGGRRPGTVNNEMIKWQEKHKLSTQRPDEKTLKLWAAQCSHLNVAVVLGPASGHTFVIDIDVTENELSAQIQELAEKMLGRTPLRRVGRWPKMALVYRHAPEDEIPGRSPKFAAYDAAGNMISGDQGLEIISSGQAMTFYGKHHRTGRYFNWLEGPPQMLGPGAAPLVTSTQINDFLDAVDSIRRFHRSQSFDSSVTTWEWDENAKVHIPRIRSAGAATNWVEDENGIVIDGRENYLRDLSARVVIANPSFAMDPSGNGLKILTAIVLDQFSNTAEMSGRWRGRNLEREAEQRVNSAAGKIRSGTWKPSEPQRDEKGAYIASTMVLNYIPAQPRKKGGDSLDFLPPFVDVTAASFSPESRDQRRPIKCQINPPEEGAEEDRRISEDRTEVAAAVSEGLIRSFHSFWDEVYDSSRLMPRVHILKAPTGAGKTSRGIQFIATDPRTKEPFTIRGEHGEIVHEGRSPIVFLLPTYANIDELRNRAQVLNLDPTLPDDELRAQASQHSLIHEDDLEEKLAELRRDAKAAGLTTMIYKGKLRAECKMAEKVKLAMEAGIGTAGFCKAEVRTDKKDENGKPIVEEKFCPYYTECPAILQRKQIEESHVVFMPHAFLSLQIPEELKTVRAVVADERIHHLFLHTATFDAAALTWPRKPPKLTKTEKELGVPDTEFQKEREKAARIVNGALMRNECPVEALATFSESGPDGQPITVQWVKSALRTCGASIQRDGSVTPEMTLEQVKELCAQPTGKLVREEYRFWKIVEERLELRIREILHEKLHRETGCPIPPRVTKGDRDYRIQKFWDPSLPNEMGIRISWRETPNWVDRPLLLLDASAAPDMISKIWSGKEVVVHDIPAALNVRIVGVVDRTYSNASVIAPPTATAQEKLTSARLLNKVRKVITMLSSLYGWSRVVAGGSILVRRAVNSQWEGPHNVDWCHYGAMRGLDFAKHHAAAVSVGRMELPIRTIDGLVAALTYDDDQPEQPYDLNGTGLDVNKQPLRTPTGTQRIRMRSGHDIEMPVPMFPGRWGRMIQKQYREEELLQFLGRLRPVYREGDAPIWFSLSSVIPEEVIVDDLVHIDDLIGHGPREVRLWEAVRRSHGVLDPDVALAQCDDLYASRRAVLREMKAVGLDPDGEAASGRATWGLVGIKWKEEDGATGTSYVRGDLANPEEALRNARAGVLGREPVYLEKISQGRSQTMARGRIPDKIEDELGTLDARRQAETDLTATVDKEIVMNTPPEALSRFLERTERPVPLLVPVVIEEKLEDGTGKVRLDENVSLEELRAKAAIDGLWDRLGRSVTVKADIDTGANSTLHAAEVENAAVSYEDLGGHVMDGENEQANSEFDELDHVIPW